MSELYPSCGQPICAASAADDRPLGRGVVTALTNLPRNHFRAILADPPWSFEAWSAKGSDRFPGYPTMPLEALFRLPVSDLAAPDCVLFLWFCWPSLPRALRLLDAWGFVYKSCAFAWMKVNADGSPFAGLGYWTRANTESCLLATRGKPKRLNADVRQAVLEPRREHSRKPDCVHERIERLVAGPYLELFARRKRPGWDCWGDQISRFADRPGEPTR